MIELILFFCLFGCAMFAVDYFGKASTRYFARKYGYTFDKTFCNICDGHLVKEHTETQLRACKRAFDRFEDYEIH